MSAAPGGLVATKDVELGGLDAHANKHATHHLDHELKSKEDVEKEAQERCVITEHMLSLPDLAKQMEVDFATGLSSSGKLFSFSLFIINILADYYQSIR